MIIELGHFALILAFVLSFIQMALPALPFFASDKNNLSFVVKIIFKTTWLIFFFTIVAFLSLVYAYAVSDFSVINVWQNSHSQMPTLFKLTGVWGNHEGSMLLWVLILALFTALASLASLPSSFKLKLLSLQGLLLFSFFAFILFTSNPFLRQPSLLQGQDLNPILQDIGLAIHPPMLYLGYVGFSITFSFACVALLEGKCDRQWARWVRGWALSAWICLTAGITLGSYWAYYELGWGGWWFWDPVENASFLPWLTATAFLHCLLVVEKRQSLKIWTVLLAILTFSLSLLGTFLVRSGVLTSVHVFASDPARGLFILLILCLFVGGALFLFSTKSHHLVAVKQTGLFAPLSREGALVFNNLILCTAAASILFGTLYPLIYETISGGEKISVGAPFFNIIFTPLMIPLFIVLPIAPLLAWKQADLQKLYGRLYFLFFITLFVSIFIYAWHNEGPTLAPFALALAVWVLFGSMGEIIMRGGFFIVPIKIAIRRLFGLPKSIFSTALAHFGMGVCLLGIVSVSAYESEKVVYLAKGDIVQFHHFTIAYESMEEKTQNNYTSDILHLAITPKGKRQFIASPSTRTFFTRQTQTSEAAIDTFLFSQLYITLGDSFEGKSTVVLRWKPLVLLIWLGPLLMALAGIMAIIFRTKESQMRKIK